MSKAPRLALHATAFRPRLRLILLLANMVVLSLPLGGVLLMRLYESALVRQTESALITQAAFLGTVYQTHYLKDNAPEIQSPEIQSPEIQSFETFYAKLDFSQSDIQSALDAPTQTQTSQLAPLALEAAQALLPVMNATQSITRAHVHILDAQGRVLVSNVHPTGTLLAQNKDVKEAMQGTPSSYLFAKNKGSENWFWRLFARGDDVRVHVALPISHQGQVVGIINLARTPSTIADTLSGKTSEIIIGVAMILALMIALSLFTSLTISRPLRNLAKQASAIANAQQSLFNPIKRPITVEVASLSDALSKMAQTLQKRTDYIRQFTAHLSHELKSPLTAIQGSVELIQDNPQMPPAQQQQFLSNISKDVARLRHLVASVLELSRAEILDSQPSSQTTFAAILPSLQLHCSQGAIPLTLDLDDDLKQRAILIGQENLYSVVKNLVDNAHIHAKPPLTLSLRHDESALHIIVSDHGEGLCETELKRALEPFYTTMREKGGTGLGLPLVKTLLTSVHGRLDYRRTQSLSQFIAVIPLAA